MKLFVGGLTPWISEALLRDRFSSYGKVDSVQIIRDQVSGQSRRFGFVEMPISGEARKAIKALNGTDLGGLVIHVAGNQQHLRGTA